MLQYDTAKVTVLRLLEKQNKLWNAFALFWVLEIWRPYLEQENLERVLVAIKWLSLNQRVEDLNTCSKPVT